MEIICDALHDLVPFVQFKKREKHPWTSVTFSKVGCFSRFLNCTNGTKSGNPTHLKGMKSLLSNNSKFIPLNIDKIKWLNYIVNLKKKIKEHFKILENNNKASEDEFKCICPIGTHSGILYGLPKVNKIVIDNIPKFWPILSAIGTPVYKLAKCLVLILSPLTVNDYTVKDSFSFAKEVVNFDHSLFMGSLDAESLFTNILIDETIINLVGDLFSNNMYQEKLSKSNRYYLLKLATSESSFIFDNILYKQIYGFVFRAYFNECILVSLRKALA